MSKIDPLDIPAIKDQFEHLLKYYSSYCGLNPSRSQLQNVTGEAELQFDKF